MHSSLPRCALVGLLIASTVSFVNTLYIPHEFSYGSSDELTLFEPKRELEERGFLPLLGVIIGSLGLTSGLAGLGRGEKNARKGAEALKKVAEKEDKKHEQVMDGVGKVEDAVKAIPNEGRGIRRPFSHPHGTASFPGLLTDVSQYCPEGARLKDWERCSEDFMRRRWFGNDAIVVYTSQLEDKTWSAQLRMPVPCMEILQANVTASNTDIESQPMIKDCSSHRLLANWASKDCIQIEGLSETDAVELRTQMAKMLAEDED